MAFHNSMSFIRARKALMCALVIAVIITSLLILRYFGYEVAIQTKTLKFLTKEYPVNDNVEYNKSKEIDQLMISYDDHLEEKIDNLEKINMPYLWNYRNPCWYETIPEHNTSEFYDINQHTYGTKMFAELHLSNQAIKEDLAAGQKRRLRCLPLLYVLGIAKCGTTDLLHTLMQHPHITRAALKEPRYWQNIRWANRRTHLHEYVDVFDKAARKIQRTTVPEKDNGKNLFHPQITVDMSIATLCIFSGTEDVFHDNEVGFGPRHIAADMIKNLTPQAKIAVIIRNPTERLYSGYMYFNKDETDKPNATEFHMLVTKAIEKMNSCLLKNIVRYCVYEKNYYYTTHRYVRLWIGMYAPFIKDWIKVFPDMRIYRTEDYSRNRTEVYADLLKFIGLDYIQDDNINFGRVVNKSPTRPTMWPRTRKLLDHFYKPFNQELATILNDSRFLFKD